ncbi:dTDP-4-dehydrorhamnose reductase [Flammeovirga aprica]|uniref:dTDP-4-dehydrorhamnose reductase n=1 Tax=Flammeovirga aprica JL-4 TaxID=694437 RepID=A0A7X9P252_9BACT|nr:dTDP-4-dehydrorhamnose reductase [Flammeovirga aprica]NME67783.1 dTDP-4-dehydrorhamnose reductase [Flammeovirga aprica JL-4]
MNILVTGKNGQLGSEISILTNQYPNFNFVFTDIEELDITDKEAVQNFFIQQKIDLIINCAAYTAVDNAEDNFDIANKVNNIAVKYLTEEAEKHNSKIIHISTDYVFNGNNYLPYKEEDPTSPIGVYGETKLQGEQHILNSSTQGLIIRTSWVYSTFGNNFVKTMLRLGTERDNLGVIGDQVGTPTNARDLALACLEIASKTELWSKENEIYHFSNLGVCSWYDFAFEIMKLSTLDCQVNLIETKDYPTKAKRPQYSVLNKAKITKQFGVKNKHWSISLKETIEQL